MKISTILDQVDLGAIALPEFQRGYVWNRNQVRELMSSLYRRYPVGSLLVWATKTEQADARGDGPLTQGYVKLLLDGQQRITSLYGIIRGRAPRFFDGNVDTFSGLRFHVKDEVFEYYGPVKMRDDPLWIDVTELMQKGASHFVKLLFQHPELSEAPELYMNRLNALAGIRDIDLHIEEVTGEDKTVDIVVDIFNKVNSGGTKLSKGDLALARICAMWPEARDELKGRLAKWQRAGYDFKLDWWLRCITVVATGEAYFTALKDLDTAAFGRALGEAERSVDMLLNLIASRLGLDHDQVLGSRYSFPLLARYLAQKHWRLDDYRERDRLLYWYVHTFLWGRYAGSTESTLNQDLAHIEQIDSGLDRLIAQLRQNRGNLRIQPDDFMSWSRSARFYPLLYMLTRVHHAQDWESGIELSQHILGRLSSLQLHHIFPRSLLYKHGYGKAEVNALANFTFLTQETNLRVSNRNPAEYLEEYVQRQPGVIESHWIPMDRRLWRIGNFPEFLAARRELLAQAANQFMDSLLAGQKERALAESVDVVERIAPPAPVGGILDGAEEQMLLECNVWVEQQGLPEGEFAYEAVDEESGEPLVIIDLAWPRGLQPGYSQPVAVLLDEEAETEKRVNALGYRFFTDMDDFRRYVREEILAVTPDGNGNRTAEVANQQVN